MTPATSPQLRSAQIIVPALLVGIIGLTVVAMFIGPTDPRPAATPGVAPVAPFGGLDPLLLAMGLLMIGQVPVLVFLGFGIQKQAASLAARHADAPEVRERVLATLWLNATILRAALAEGVGLFGGVILLLRGDHLAFIGIGFAVVVLLALLPTRGRLESWIQRAINAAVMLPGPGQRV